MSLLALIPARGGSKGIPRKNIRLFCGKPLLQWSIEVAQSVDCIDQVVVSTDDVDIAEIARQAGADDSAAARGIEHLARPGDLQD